MSQDDVINNDFYKFLSKHNKNEIPNGCILIVDDDYDQLILFEAMLKKCGFDVVTANSATEAVEVLMSGEKITLVITDVMMPQIDGESLIRAIRSSEKYEDLPIIALTAGCIEAQEWTKRDDGPDMFCLK